MLTQKIVHKHGCQELAFSRKVLTSALKSNSMKNLTIYAILFALLVSCQVSVQSDEELPLIKKNQLELNSDIMSPEVLWAFGRLSDVQVSPDGQKILYGVSYYHVEQNKSNRELFVMNADGSGKSN
jgi:hypothetical protein